MRLDATYFVVVGIDVVAAVCSMVVEVLLILALSFLSQTVMLLRWSFLVLFLGCLCRRVSQKSPERGEISLSCRERSICEETYCLVANKAGKE